MKMRTDFDFAPFYRATVGFDRVFDMLDSVTSQSNGGYPPYNIEKTGDDSYRIVMAVAGFAESELNIVQEEGELVVTGRTASGAGEDKEYLYRGIAARDFERRFQLADHVKVVGATLANGLLNIELKREIPEEKKARAIRIQTDAAAGRISQQ
jgi:molecular chaperone IbpA